MARQKTQSRRRGQVLSLAPVMAIALGGVFALTGDVGQMTVCRATLQNAADAASLAGTHILIAGRGNGLTEVAARDVAVAEARLIQQANVDGPRIHVDFGDVTTSGSFVSLATDETAMAVKVTVIRDELAPAGPVRLAMAALIGLASSDVRASAVARANPYVTSWPGSLAPFGIPATNIVGPGEDMGFYPADGDDYDCIADSQVVAGNWALLNMNGGSLGTPEIEDWILNGYQGDLSTDPDAGDLWIEGTSGFRAAIEDEIMSRIGTEMTMLVYDTVEGTGANANFRIVGFVRGIVNGVNLTGKGAYADMTLTEMGDLHDLTTGGSYASPNISKIHLAA